MRTYADSRTITRAAEILAEWSTILGRRSRLPGSTAFTRVAHGAPGRAAR